MRVTFYCPDRHLQYDGHTPDQRGVGGGVTARLRLAAALAKRGNDVEVVCNCERATRVNGVRFSPLDSVRRIDTGAFVMHTTGDKLDLTPVLSLPLQCERKIVFVDGVDAPKALHDVGMEKLYACSNFISDIAQREWHVPRGKIFVTHHGVIKSYFKRPWWKWSDARHTYRIAYATHPSKGLAPAVAVLRRLRQADTRFELHVFGGNRLWGQPEAQASTEPGLVYHGLLGQRALAAKLVECGFALYLQTRAEPFGIAIAEALAAGCVTIASAVGAHPEIIDPGVAGFLIEGDPAAGTVQAEAAAVIARAAADPDFMETIERRAQASPLDWDTVARTWEQLWQGREAADPANTQRCPRCGGQWTLLADGYHCFACSYYAKKPVS